MNKTRGAAVLAASLVATMAVGAAPATAKHGGDDDGERRVSGHCSGGAHWKLKAKRDDGRIEWEFEVDSNRRGQKWGVRVRDNGVLVMAGKRTTTGRSGSFEVERKTANRRGADHFVASARHGARGQLCTGRLTF